MAKPELWRCQTCGSRNRLDLHRCRICTRPRPGVLESGRAEIDTPEIAGLPPLPEHHHAPEDHRHAPEQHHPAPEQRHPAPAATEPTPTKQRSDLTDPTGSKPQPAAPASPRKLI